MGCVCSKKEGEDLQFVDLHLQSPDFHQRKITKDSKKEITNKTNFEDDFMDPLNRTNIEINIYRNKKSKLF